GHLGGFYDSSTVDVPSSESLNDDSTSLNSVNDDDGDGYLLLGGIVVIMLMVIVGIFVFNKKKHK
ncbi:MAG: hypothetical protein FWH37_04600, partial [Candidatus Bathyarchaeota archaeon]|nr:hypothetical protein [Candidatus Termiticorpusculum sp.]